MQPSQSGRVAIALCGLAFVSLGCAASQPTAPQANREQAARTVLVSEPWGVDATELAPDPMFSCIADHDCTVVEMGCCDQCNGRWPLAVHRDHVAEANARWHDPTCIDAPCTKIVCSTELSPICDGGVCARREEQLDRAGALEVTIVRNALPSR